MNNQNKHYRQLTQELRYQVSALRKAGMSLRGVSEIVGVYFSTISREIQRISSKDGYEPQVAQELSESR